MLIQHYGFTEVQISDQLIAWVQYLMEKVKDLSKE